MSEMIAYLIAPAVAKMLCGAFRLVTFMAVCVWVSTVWIWG